MARMSASGRVHQPEALARSGFQPYRPDERSANAANAAAAAAAAAAVAGVYPPLDAFPPFNTMPLPAGMCYIGIFFSGNSQFEYIDFINNETHFSLFFFSFCFYFLSSIQRWNVQSSSISVF